MLVWLSVTDRCSRKPNGKKAVCPLSSPNLRKPSGKGRRPTLMAKSQCSLAVVSCSMCLSTSATERLQLLFFLPQTTLSSPVRTLCSSEFRSLQLSERGWGENPLNRQTGNECSQLLLPEGDHLGAMEEQWSTAFPKSASSSPIPLAVAWGLQPVRTYD